jgi:cation:H+ antiporter
MTYVSIVVGMVVLLAGGELLVRHASRLAISIGISPLVVGLTIVALGTSSPELMSSVYGQWVGQGSLAVGNVVGSNIFNALFILGFSALAAPLVVDTKLLRLEVPGVVALSLLVWGFASSGTIARWEAGILLVVLVVDTIWLVVESRRAGGDGEAPAVEEASEAVADAPSHWAISAGLIVVGLVLVVVGGRYFVAGAVEVARSFEIEESIIGLTIVAAGTSLPELVTSVLASYRGHREIAVGNVIGSNLFNLTAVLGVAGMVGPGGLEVTPSLIGFDLPVMTATAIFSLPVFVTGGRIDRWEGGVFILYYLGYVTYLVLLAAGHPAAAPFGRAVLWFVVPLTLLTLAVIGFQKAGD